jgi:hypothetical protein
MLELDTRRKCGNTDCECIKNGICVLGYISQPALQCRDYKEPKES